jgi:hypothetical protein
MPYQPRDSSRFPFERTSQRFRRAEPDAPYADDERRARRGERSFGWARRRDIEDMDSQRAAPHGRGEYDRGGEDRYAEGLRRFEGNEGIEPRRMRRWELDEGGVEFGSRAGRGPETFSSRDDTAQRELRHRGFEDTWRREADDGYGVMRDDYGRDALRGYDRPTGLHRGRGPRGYQRSDERIREDVCDRLTDDDELDASDVDVQVQSGTVVLTGAVESREAKRRAEDVAETVSGVREVQNNLRLRSVVSDQHRRSGGGTGTAPL